MACANGGIKTGFHRFLSLKNGAVALRKMVQDIVGINPSSILYLVYVLLSATPPYPPVRDNQENPLGRKTLPRHTYPHRP